MVFSRIDKLVVVIAKLSPAQFQLSFSLAGMRLVLFPPTHPTTHPPTQASAGKNHRRARVITHININISGGLKHDFRLICAPESI